MCVFICTICVWVKTRLLVCVCVRERERERLRRLLALLIVHRWVFTIGKGELERKWWTPCVVDESVPEGTLDTAPFTDICVVVFEIERERERKKMLRLESHVCSLVDFMPEWLYFYIYYTVYLLQSDVFEWVCLFVCTSVSAWQGRAVCCLSVAWEGSNPARLQESAPHLAKRGWHSSGKLPRSTAHSCCYNYPAAPWRAPGKDGGGGTEWREVLGAITT